MNDEEQRARRIYPETSFSHNDGEFVVFSLAFRSLGRLFQRLGRHLPTVLSCVLLGALVGLALSHLFRPKVYQANVLFEMVASPLKLVFEPISYQQEKEGREEEGKESQPPAAKKNINKKEQEEERKATMVNYQTILLSPQVQELTRKRLLSHGIEEMASLTYVNSLHPTNLIEAGVQHPDPLIAHETADVWAQAIIDFLIDFNSQQFQMGKSFFWTQYHKSKKEIANLDSQIIDLKKKAQFELKETELRAKKELLLAHITDLEKTKASLAEIQTTLPLIEEQENREKENDPVLKHFLATRGDAAIQASLLKKISKDPDKLLQTEQLVKGMRDIPKLVNPIYSDLLEKRVELESELLIQKSKIERLEDSVQRLTKEATQLETELSESRVQLASLERDLEIGRKQNEMIFSRVSEADLASAMRFAELRIVSLSALPTSPMPPQKRLFMLGGACAGLFLGFFLSAYLILPMFDKRAELKTNQIRTASVPLERILREPQEVN